MNEYKPTQGNVSFKTVDRLEELRQVFSDKLITPDQAGYDQARTIFYGGFDRRPGAILKARTEEDVVRAVQLARQSHWELAVRGGGHSSAGHSVCEGGLVLDLSSLRDLQIDPQERTAWAEPGLTAGEYTLAAAEHSLATGFGDTASVGIGGLTLGGGIGYLVRKYGLTIDSLLAARLVTADGRVLELSEESNPDLFWAIRGGGGNFGVVTRLKFRLHPVDTVFGGMLVLPATPEVVAGFAALAEAAPDELSTILNIITAPPMPFLPPETVGKPVAMAMLVYAGDVEAGRRVLEPFAALAKPYANMLRPMRYPEIYMPEQADYHPIAASRTQFVDEIDTAAATTLLEGLRSSKAKMAAAQVRVLGGAYARVPADATAYAHRGARIMLSLAALCDTLEEKYTHEAWVSNLASALRQSNSGAYVNFLSDEGPARVRAAYPGATWKRLAAIKAQVDPQNFFHLNQNIPPRAK